MADKLIVDCTSGKRRTLPLSDDEIADAEARSEAYMSEQASEPVDRVAALEARLDAVAALAEKASTTATEVAAAAKPTR